MILPPDGGDEQVSDAEFEDEDNLDPIQTWPVETAGTLELHTAAGSGEDSQSVSGCGKGSTTSSQSKRAGTAKASTKGPVWKSSSRITPMEGSEPSPFLVGHPEMEGKTPIEVFRMYWDDKMCDMIVKESNHYARQRNDQTFELTRGELDQFLGIVLLTGYISLPRQRMYWEKSEDFQIPIIGKSLSRSRFEQIKRNLHFANNEDLPAGDKAAKVRPLLEELNRVLLQFGVIDSKLSVDEQMVPYFGRHSCKMFMKGKPVRFGFKLWVLASSGGYPYRVELYTGKNTGQSDNSQTESLGLGGDVVLRLLDCLQAPQQHEVYFDNFFSSYGLITTLREKGIRATGTVRDNRLKKCPLPDNKTADKANRGEYWCKASDGVLAVKWKDNKAVTVVTNHSGVTPLKKASRWSQKEKKKVQVTQPYLIHEYNQYMGGVDLVDGAVGVYRPALRWNKWYGTLVINTFGLLRVAAWQMHRRCSKEVDQLTFTREIALELLKNPAKGQGGRSDASYKPGPSSGKVKVVSRLQDNHFIVPAAKQGRCRLCLKNTRTMCNICEVRLHNHCSQQYHS